MEVEEELIPNETLVSADVCSGANINPETPPMTSRSTNTRETDCYDVGRTEPRPGVSFRSGQLDLATDELYHPKPHDADIQQALIEPVSSPPPLKPIFKRQPQFPQLLHTPISRQTLYDNLRLSLTLKPLPPFPALVDYHDSFPEFRSTKSYNFLIELSIRHAQFGVTSWLFDAMIQDKIPRTSMTRTLLIRWLVRTGRWEQAWTRATSSTPDEVLYKPIRNGLPPVTIQIPWYRWTELLFTCKRGALRRTRNFRWGTDEEGNPARLPAVQIVKDPAPGTEAYMRRQRLLACVQPILDSNTNHKTLPPRLIRGAVYAILRDGRASQAADLIKAYFSALPPNISDQTVAQCMSLIHLILGANTGDNFASKRGLLRALLKIHPSFKPSSTTLFHLLAPLRDVKKSGTVAFSAMRALEKQWGDEVVDTRVRRRVGSLAQKQGQVDILQTLLDEELLARRTAKSAPSVTAVPSTPTLSDLQGLRRPSDQVLFPHKGTQTVLWTRFRLRIRWKQRVDGRVGSDIIE